MAKVIILEGPAGSGKTTFSIKIRDALMRSNYNVKLLTEFSETEIGTFLKANSAFGAEQPALCKGFQGVLLYIHDKVNAIKSVSNEAYDYVIVDRFITTQFVLGLPSITNETERCYVYALIAHLEQELTQQFEAYYAINLYADIETLTKRLTRRIAQKLNKNHIEHLNYQIDAYKTINATSQLHYVALHNTESEDVFSELKELIYANC